MTVGDVIDWLLNIKLEQIGLTLFVIIWLLSLLRRGPKPKSREQLEIEYKDSECAEIRELVYECDYDRHTLVSLMELRHGPEWKNKVPHLLEKIEFHSINEPPKKPPYWTSDEELEAWKQEVVAYDQS